MTSITTRRHACAVALALLAATGLVACDADRTSALPDLPDLLDDSSADREADTGDTRYSIGRVELRDLWVDPRRGRDSNSGSSRSRALRTVAEAWRRIPQGRTLSTGYHIRLVRGSYGETQLPSNSWWESRHGTRRHPVILEAADGTGSVTIRAGVNAFDLRYFYVVGIRFVPTGSGDVFHCERCDHVLLRRVRLAGDGSPQEVLKVNQSKYVYVEASNIYGAAQNAIDFVAVQHGRIAGNRIHDADDWCMYLKGGSAYFRVEGNRIYDCGTGGFTAGQGTGFEYMRSPWLHYEAYDVKFVSNLVYDTDGAGMGVNGGYDILLAYNTLYRVGRVSHALEFAQGARSCDGDSARCAANRRAGGWGSPTADGQWIPNRNVFVYDNVLYNPDGYRSRWQHFDFHGPATPPAGTGVPAPAPADTNLRIVGNVIWNGPTDLPLGTGGGCRSSNPTCNATRLRRDNLINRVRPQLADPAHGDFRPVAGRIPASRAAHAIPAFTWTGLPARPAVPPGTLGNAVPRTFGGGSRRGWGHPGAL